MASTYSTLKIELIGTGEQSGTWGTTTNTNLGTAIEEAIVGSADVPFSSADVTVTLTDTNAAQAARNLRLNLTGTSGGARNLILGSGCQIEKPYLINNGLADTVTVKNTAGTGIAVPAGKTMWVYNNGTNVVDAVTHLSSLTLSTALPIASGGTGTTSTTFVNLTTNVTGTLPIANGGTGTTSTTFVNLATNVTGDLPFANLTQIAGLSVLGVTGNSTADVAGVTAGTDNQVLRRSGTALAFGAVNLASTDAVTGDLPFTNIAQIAGLSVAGRSANTTGDLAAITAAADHNVLRRSGTTIGFGAINLAQSGAVTGTLAAGNGGTGITSLGTGVATWLGTPSSANLATAVTDETGTGSLVFATSPTLVTPLLGTPTSGNLTNCTADGTNKVGYLNIPAVADKTTSYSLATGDIGKVVGVGSGGSITIPNSTFAAGDAVLIFNNTAGDITITCTITTAYIAGTDADVASVTLATRGVCNILFLSGTACVLTGNIA